MFLTCWSAAEEGKLAESTTFVLLHCSSVGKCYVPDLQIWSTGMYQSRIYRGGTVSISHICTPHCSGLGKWYNPDLKIWSNQERTTDAVEGRTVRLKVSFLVFLTPSKNEYLTLTVGADQLPWLIFFIWSFALNVMTAFLCLLAAAAFTRWRCQVCQMRPIDMNCIHANYCFALVFASICS